MSRTITIDGGGPKELEKFLKALGVVPGAEDGDEKVSLPIPEAQKMELENFLALYTQPNPYKVGDWIHPRKNGMLRGYGRPHIVVEVAETPHRNFQTNNSGSAEYGRRHDIRVATYSDTPGQENVVVTFWGEHHCYEPFDFDKKYD